jgi:hypothetical protein
VNPRRITFRHAFQLGSLDRSRQAVEALRERYGEELPRALGVDAEVRWHAQEGRAGLTNDQLWIEHPDGGYNDVDVEVAAQWAIEVCSTWLRITGDVPAGLLPEPDAS